MFDRLKKLYKSTKGEVKLGLSIFTKLMRVALKTRKSAVGLYLCGAILEIAGSLLTIFASAKVFSLLAIYVVSGGSADTIWFWLVVDLIAIVIMGVGHWLMSYSGRLVYFALNQWSVVVFDEALCRIDIPDFYDDKLRTEIIKASDGYTWQIPNLAYTYLELIYGLLRFLAIAAVVAQIQWWLIFVIALFLLPTFLSQASIAQIQWIIWGEKGDNRNIFAGIQHLMTKARSQMEMRSMQTKKHLIKRIDIINREFYQAQEVKFKKAARKDLFARVLEVGGVAVGAIILLRQVIGGSISLDRYFFLSGALFRIDSALNSVFGTLSRIQEPQRFCASFFELIEYQPKIIDKLGAIQLDPSVAPTIEFRDVSFKYPTKDHQVFEKLNITIEPGEHIALVGENGAGKTTFIKLLLRFYVPDSGKILINGHDLQDIAIDSWNTQLATLMQSFNEYPLTISENIEIGRSDQKLNQQNLEDAMEFASIDKMVKGYKHGLNTVLDASFKKGVEPSGGQWQRVALARAFYRKANVLILDEPTAAIDAKAEYDIFNNIFKHFKEKTAIIVSHRFSTVRRADRIIVLDNGQIIEQGSHAELMKKSGLYHELFTKQAEGYKD